MKTILGDHSRQFSLIRAYCELILQTNPGSTDVLKCEPQPPIMNNGIIKELPPRFQRIYVSFHACKAGFTAGCRPIVGLDGCFLKSHFGGHLLSAIGRDGDDGMFPIAMAIVEAENRDSWTWFMFQLLNDMCGVDPTNIVFISDMQKGLVQTFEDLLLYTEHRFCLKHLNEKFKKQWKGKHYQDMLWQAALATTICQFEKVMRKLEKSEDVKAYQYLKRLKPSSWTKSHFSFKAKTDVLVNNISECFNAYILQERELPIMSLIEGIRTKLMKRLYMKRTSMEAYADKITPNIQKHLDRIKANSRDCVSTPAGGKKFEVKCKGKNVTVELEARSCSCRLWGLTGIPCVHAISAIRYCREDPEDYVDQFFSKNMYLKTYSEIINPMPDIEESLGSTSDAIAAPIIKKPPGRPKKLRRRQPDEPRNLCKVTRMYRPIKCGNCCKEGHNVRNCKASVIGETTWQRRVRMQKEQDQMRAYHSAQMSEAMAQQMITSSSMPSVGSSANGSSNMPWAGPNAVGSSSVAGISSASESQPP